MIIGIFTQKNNKANKLILFDRAHKIFAGLKSKNANKHGIPQVSNIMTVP